jgi:hypothetical protein
MHKGGIGRRVCVLDVKEALALLKAHGTTNLWHRPYYTDTLRPDNADRPMKVLHIVSRFYPDQGGSEKSVGGLIEGLRALGVSGSVVCFGDSPAESRWRGVPVRRLRWSPFSGADSEEYMCFGDREVAAVFGAVLEAERPDVVHLHTRTREVALELVSEVSARGIRRLRTIICCHAWRTYCAGTAGLRRCARDGRCAACQLAPKGFRDLQRWLAAVPRASAAAAFVLPAAGEALLTSRRTGILHDRCGNSFGVLSLHRALFVEPRPPRPQRRFVRPDQHRQAWVAGRRSRAGRATVAGNRCGTPLRLIYLGRIHPTKGVHVVEALREPSG